LLSYGPTQTHHPIEKAVTLIFCSQRTKVTPTFVYMILFIYFVVFNIFAVNMVLQYKGVGRWRDYLYGERVYIILSFVAKSILAWLVFIGVFAPF